MTNHKVSINVLTYNHEKYISKTIESILLQRVNFEYEVHFFDDASIDNTVGIIQSFHRSNFHIHVNSQNQGISKNFCNALLAVNTDYIYDLAGDDYIPNENVLQKCVDFLDTHADYSGVSGWTEIRDISENIIGIDKNEENEFTLEKWLMGNRPMCSHGMIRRFWSDYDKWKIERIAKAVRDNEEIAAWTSFLEYGSKAILQESVYGYRYVSQTGQSTYNSNHNSIDIFRDNYMAICYMREHSELCMEGLLLKYAYRYITQSLVNRKWRALIKQWNVMKGKDKIKCFFSFPYIFLNRGKIPNRIRRAIRKSISIGRNNNG